MSTAAITSNQFKALCARVRWICTVLEEGSDFWQLLPYFVNLETLEVHGCDQEAAEGRHAAFDASAPLLPKLRFAKLIGYVSTPVVSWLLASGNTIQRLELKLLKEGIPRAPELQEILAAHPEDVDSPLREDRGGTTDGWSCIPQPLSGFLPRRGNGEYYLVLPKLRYLYLCQPSDNNLDSELMQNYLWSTHAEATAHEDWEKTLQASSSTLETLILEQKIGIEDTGPEWEREHQYIRSDHDGLRSERLIKIIEGVLQRELFPVLKCLYAHKTTGRTILGVRRRIGNDDTKFSGTVYAIAKLLYTDFHNEYRKGIAYLGFDPAAP
ncbi:uncharacterized protein FTOL_05193 [Fusarium torulosum]|uniref:Uncharacterized protein n=1 Tax=Fusarium torulosum TaxID=33205 RepID=A0AAE8M7F1_9HYPO|nr:uncharacterized protein FTOL_05193 [Fusarium torulosum]